MRRNLLYILLAFLMLESCAGVTGRDAADEMNQRSYAYRYVDIDSSLHYARLAYDASATYPDGRAEALNNMAYVCYQQMRFTQAQSMLTRVYALTSNQIELMCADVMLMKVMQRTMDWREFYRAMNNARMRQRRIIEEMETLSPRQMWRFNFAQSEMHIIASTFFYYQREDSMAIAEIGMLSSMMRTPQDTAQWLYYHYMLGSGGLISGDPLQVRLQEFDHIVQTLVMSKRQGNIYFHANALQSLSKVCADKELVAYLRRERGGSFDFLELQYHVPADSLPLVLAREAYRTFVRGKDLFQSANTMRTQGEILFSMGRYHEALHHYRKAMQLVRSQRSRSSRGVPQWSAGIHEKMSLAYSALGDTVNALRQREQYLGKLETMRQDLELEARSDELGEYNRHLYRRLANIAILALIISLFFLWLRRKSRLRTAQEVIDAEEQLQSIQDETTAMIQRLGKEKTGNLERRAKVSLSESITPLIDRLLVACDNHHDKDYIQAVTAEIERLNGILTDWVTVSQGRLSMNISSFPLQPLLDTLALNKVSYQRKNLDLHIPRTDAVVKGDRILTLFMLNTLCDNSRKFTPEGGSVSIRIDECTDYVELSVCDTGCGMSQEDVDTIVSSKVYDSSAIGGGTTSGKGHGFGLMNCKGIIGQMKKMSSRFACCDFGIESTLGQGSRFWFRLPRVMSLLIALIITAAATAQSHAELDSLMNLSNRLAIEAQSDCRWDDYDRHNAECIRLHNLLTADPDLPHYAEIIRSRELYSQMALYATVIMVFGALISLMLMIRHMLSDKRDGELLEERMTEARERLARARYEMERLYVQNQILDNCMSTIKHETMYYPARISQITALGGESSEVSSLCHYYHDIYTLLLAQAQRQTSSRIRIDEDIERELRARVNLILERYRATGEDLPDNLFTTEVGDHDPLVVREILRLMDAQQGHPGLRLYVKNNEINITLCKNSKLSLSKTSSWS